MSEKKIFLFDARQGKKYNTELSTISDLVIIDESDTN